MSTLLGAVARHEQARDLAGEIADGLRAVIDMTTRPETRVVFGGHFSCGKSTLINALIGRPVLPTGEFPETGVACVLRADGSDRVHKIDTTGAAVDLPFSAETIRHEIGLTGNDGSYRPHVHQTRAIRIGLAGHLPPPGATWIDSPGISDQHATSERARATATLADVLVWVIDSRRPLSEGEQQFLRTHVASHGPSSVVFIVNAFLAEDNPQEWARFQAKHVEYIQRRISDIDITAPLPPVIETVSARGMALDRAGYGGPQARALLCPGNDDPLGAVNATLRTRTLLTRITQAEHRLSVLVDKVGAQVERERRRLHGLAETRAALLREGERRRRLLVPQLDAALTDLFDRCIAELEANVAAVRAAITGQQPLRRDNTYGDTLTAAMARLTDRLADDIVAEASRRTTANGLSPVDPAAASQLHAMLRPTPITITVPAPRKGGGGTGAWIGGVIGTVVTFHPGVGTVVGAAIGAAVERGSTMATARTHDRKAAANNLDAAYRALVTELRNRRDPALRLVLEPTATPVALPNSPHHALYDALVALHRHLIEVIPSAVGAAHANAVEEKTAAELGRLARG